METTVGTSWSLGTLIGFPIGILITLTYLYFLYRMVRWLKAENAKHRRRKENEFGFYPSDDRGEARFAVGVAVLLVALSAVITAASMYPFKAEYHQWRPVAGEITQSGHQVTTGGKGRVFHDYMFVINGRTYECEDNRCALLEEGDSVELLCKPEFQYASTDPYVCKFVRSEASR